MKLSLSVAAAVQLLSASTALASPIATTTDEARARAGGAIRAPAASKVGRDAVACPQACACKHG